MNRKIRDVFSAIGMVVAAFAMMTAGIGIIFLIVTVSHTHFK
jgi:hypothetical protein